MLKKKTYTVLYAGICGSDLQKVSRNNFNQFYQLGHEVVAKDDRYIYAINPLWGCGLCAACQKGNDMLCKSVQSLGRTQPGGFTGSVEVPEKNAILLSVDDPSVAVLCDPYAVVCHALRGRLKNRMSVAIIGDGVIAQLSLLYLIINDIPFSRVEFITKSKQRAYLLKKRFNKLCQNDKISFRHTTVDADSQLVIECVGRGQSDTLNQAIGISQPNGCIVSLGVYPEGFSANIAIRQLLYKQVQLVGSNSFTAKDFCKAVTDVETHTDLFTSLLGEVYTKDRMKNAYLAAKNKSSVASKIIISFPQNGIDA